MIVWDKREMNRLNRALNKSLEETALWLDKDVKDAQVVPKQTGALEDSQKVEVKGDTIEVSYDTPYAKRLYYHPEYNFSHDKNVNAKGMWLEDWKDGSRTKTIAEQYGKKLREKV